MRRQLLAGVLLVASLVACGSDGTPEPTSRPAPAFVTNVRVAIDAVERELDGPQRFFEVTSNEQFVNLFVAVDDATAAVPYVFVDGELQPPAPRQDGASGNTFRAEDVRFDDDLLLATVATELPSTTIDAVSVYGDGVGAVYVLAGTSSVGGFLDIVVGPSGQILSVDPV